jgi:putative ABC transport system ATP-binding protein
MIEFRDVYKTYFLGQNEVHALNGVSFRIEAGEMVAIMGRSGSGKTTAMNIIGLLDYPTTGEYLLNNRNVATLSKNELANLRNRSIGFVFQFFFLLPRLNALHNVCMPLIYRGTNRADMRERAIECLTKVGMDKFMDHKPNELSGGQQQRVAIARALVGDPDLILADEPTGSLDSKTGQDVMNLLIDLNRKESTTVVVVTHDINIARQCQRIIEIKDGRLVTDETEKTK